MQNPINNNDDSHIKDSTSQQLDNAGIPSNSIRFAFPERPPQQDCSHIRPYRSQTLNSLQSGASRYYTSQFRPIKHHSHPSSWINFPFFMASFCSVIGTFMSVRASVVRGYLVDHSLWDGKGHHYDQNPLVFLNSTELLLVMMSLLCGLCVCALVVLKTRIYQNSVSDYCLIGALIQASCSLAATFLFYGRTIDLVGTLINYVYSRGFYSCAISGVVMLLAGFGFFLDWLLDSPTDGPLSIVLNAMLLPSVMYCGILSIGALTFMWIEDWEYSQAMMFCATALTTIGYGDVAPVTPTGRLVFLVYAAFGIGVVGYFLLSLRAVMINGSSFNLMMKVNLVRVESLHDYARHQRHRDRQRHRLEQQHWQQYGYGRDGFCALNVLSPTPCNSVKDDNDDDELPIAASATTIPYDLPRPHRLARHRSADVISTFSNYTLSNLLKEETRQMWVHVITRSGVWRMSVIFALSWFGGAAVFCLLEESWSYLDALYFAFATQLTIGFGDLVPQTMIAQEFWFAYIIISITVAAYFICLFGDVLAEKLLIDGENDNDSDTIGDDDDDSNGGGDCNFDGYGLRYHGIGEMVEDNNDLHRNNCILTSSSRELTSIIDSNMTPRTVFNESCYYPHQQSASASAWAAPYSRQEIPSKTSRHQSSSFQRLPITPQQQQSQNVRHQPLQYRTNSLPIISVDQYQKRHSYGTLPLSGQNTLANKKNKKKNKPSNYLPVAIASNTHHLPVD